METYPYKNNAIIWTESKSSAASIGMAFGFAIITALSAQLRIELFFTPVPITAQTFMVILSGLLLGKKYGSLSMVFYLSGGLLGLPWFSGSVAGLAILKSPTIGYLIGFIAASWIIGQYSNYIPINSYWNNYYLFFWSTRAIFSLTNFLTCSSQDRCTAFFNWRLHKSISGFWSIKKSK